MEIFKQIFKSLENQLITSSEKRLVFVKNPEKIETPRLTKTELLGQIDDLDKKIQDELDNPKISQEKRKALREKRTKLDDLREKLNRTNKITNREINLIKSDAFDDLRKAFAFNYVNEHNIYADNKTDVLLEKCLGNVFTLMKNGEKYTENFKARRNIQYAKDMNGVVDASVIGLQIEKKGNELIVTQKLQVLKKSENKKAAKELAIAKDTYSFSKTGDELKIERKGENVTGTHYMGSPENTLEEKAKAKTGIPLRNSKYAKINGGNITLQNVDDNVQIQDVLAPSLNQELVLIRNGVPQIITQKGYTWINKNAANQDKNRVRVYNGDKIQALADMPKQTMQKLAGSKYYVEKDANGKLKIVQQENLNALRNLPNNQKKLDKLTKRLGTIAATKGFKEYKGENKEITDTFKSLGESFIKIWKG
ncbi:hypothetical protein KKD70_01930, partial [Patescibacteria group bacterium]|nr:hypothetical protein [Patescibacteria group bacterium]